jgi:hypothetical protein
MKACEVIVQDRTKQLDDCKGELLKELKEGVKREKKIGKLNEESMFQEYARVTRLEGVGDHEATEMVKALLDEANVPVLPATYWKNKSKGKDESLSNTIRDNIWEHREKTHNIRKLTKELVGRVRSRRYFTVVRDLQKHRETPPKISCPGCSRDEVPLDEVAVLSSCGHTGCMACVKKSADREECVYAASGQCMAAARVLNIVKGETLGVDDEARDGRGRHFGKKLEMVIDLIKCVALLRTPLHTNSQFCTAETRFPRKSVSSSLSSSRISWLKLPTHSRCTRSNSSKYVAPRRRRAKTWKNTRTMAKSGCFS